MSAAASAAARCAATAQEAPPGTRVDFVWNMRRCTGTLIHKAALEGDLEEVRRCFTQEPAMLQSRFACATVFRGQEQDNSGLAIHLAASRGHTEVVDALLREGVPLDSWVTRDFQDSYDVLHAAVWSEGKGGSEEIVHYLLEKKAKQAENIDKKTAMHLAYQTGAVGLLPMLRRHAKAQGTLLQFMQANDHMCSPLELGIAYGHMSERALADAAAPVPASLRTFIEQEPRCLRKFLRRLRGCITPEQLARQVDGKDIAKVLRECPDAACALLEGMTARPRCEAPGLHPLPARVSFAPRTAIERLRDLVNPPQEQMAFYKRDTVWRYDGSRFKGSEWQKSIDSRSWGKPFRDADVVVCHAPDLVCTELFSALVAASGQDSANQESLRPFREPVFIGAINNAWWNGAARYDILQVGFSVWGLVLLIYDSVSGGLGTTLSVDFISAKGWIDLVFLLVKVSCWRSSALELCSRHAWWEFARCLLPSLLPLVDGKGSPFMVIIILMYWVQLFGLFTFSEHVSRSILPITRLVRGVIPATVMTGVWFCAFLHAFQVVRRDGECPWFENWSKSFATLFTGSLDMTEDTSGLQLLLMFAAVAVFTVYLLNIFIGVIGEQFQTQKDMSKETFQLVRAEKCLSFLARARILPCRLLSKKVASRVATGACIFAMALQYMVLFYGHSWPWMRPALALCQFIMVLATYQNPSAHWSTQHDKNRKADWHYLWLVLAVEQEPEEVIDVEEQGDSDSENSYEGIYAHRW